MLLLPLIPLYLLTVVTLRAEKHTCRHLNEADTEEKTTNASDYMYFDGLDNDRKDTDIFKDKHDEDYRRTYEEQFKEFPNFQDADKYLVYTCDKECGGLVDRLKGIIHVYTLSIILKRKFAIHWPNLCPLQDAWEPNLLDWRFEFDGINNISLHHIDYVSSYQQDMFLYETEDFDPLQNFTDDVIIIRSNQDWSATFRRLSVTAERFPQMFQHSNSDLTRIIFHGLFRYGKTLDDAITELGESRINGNKLACFHARMTIGERRVYEIRDLSSVFDFLKSFNTTRNYKIAIVSDSAEIKRYATDLFPADIVDTSVPFSRAPKCPQCQQGEHLKQSLPPSDTLHQNEQTCEIDFKDFVELALLSRCNTLVLTDNNVGLMASFLRHTSRDLYSFFNTHGVYPVSRENSKKMYQFRCVAKKTSYLDTCPT